MNYILQNFEADIKIKKQDNDNYKQLISEYHDMQSYL